MSTLADRLLSASGRLFVGRKTQCELFSRALKASELPFSVLHISGPGGIGKTSLLYEFRRMCRALDVPSIYLDARTIDADARAFTEAIGNLIGLSSEERVENALARAEHRYVLFIDTFEKLTSLEPWLYHGFFSRLSDRVLIVLAGRREPSPIWLNDPGWQTLIHHAPLRNLSPDESIMYLEKAGMPEDRHELVLRYTHGHPLALSLIADLHDQDSDLLLEPGLEANIIKVLLDRFLLDVPSSLHRRAIEACCLVNHLTEPLLEVLLDIDDGEVLFRWLRELSFIESGPRGIFPHDLARDVLSSDLKWRNPDQYKLLHQTARTYYNARLKDASPDDQRNLLSDYIYLHRDNPVVRPFFKRLQSTWKGDTSTVSLSVHPYTKEDEESVVNIVLDHEGEESASMARHWLQRQPRHVLLYRDQHGAIQGLLFQLALHEATDDELKADPIAWKAWHYVKQSAPLRPGEGVTLFRFWMDASSYQRISKVQSLIFVSMVRHYLTTPQLAFSLLPISRPFFWKLIFNYADLHRIKELNFKVNKASYGVYGHDWRSRPPAAWLDLLASREVWTSFEPDEEEETRPVIVLSEESFTEAVRDALRCFNQPLQLKQNPLIDSRIVGERVDTDAGNEDRVIALIELLNESMERLAQDPKRDKAYRAVDRTYIHPAGSQELAAERLGIPYSTFRRHLSQGVSDIVEGLWQQEIKR